MAVFLCFTEKHLIFITLKITVTIFPTAVMNGSDRIRHEKFCDSFFYATGLWVLLYMDEGYKQKGK